MSTPELLDEVRRRGARLEVRGDRLHVEAPKGVLTPNLKAALAEHKPEIVAALSAEFSESMRRLEAANIFIAVLDDGTMRLVQTEADVHQADGFTIYSPRDAYMYVMLSERERLLLHAFKKKYDGTTEWRQSARDSTT